MIKNHGPVLVSYPVKILFHNLFLLGCAPLDVISIPP
nr:MAG TPA: hypothetical protein [Caudoviricetes sp.]